MSDPFNFLRTEIANHQEYAVRTAGITFSAVAIILGLVTGKEAIDINLVGCGVGSLLVASLIYQNAVARKIFWIAGFLRHQDKSQEEKKYEMMLLMMRKHHPFSVGVWMETRAIAYAYAILILVFLYMFFSSPIAIVLHALALLLCFLLYCVPDIDYGAKWEGIDAKHQTPSEAVSSKTHTHDA